MHVKLEACPDAGASEVYHVIVCEDDDETPLGIIGHVTRAADGGDSWQLQLGPRDGGPHASEPTTVKAADVDELRQVLAARYVNLKLNANRLSPAAMAEFVDDLLDPAIELAEKTRSTSGVVHALVNVIARLTAQHVPDEKLDEVINGMSEQMRRAVKGLGTERAMQKQLASTLHRMFAAATQGLNEPGSGDDDEASTKH